MKTLRPFARADRDPEAARWLAEVGGERPAPPPAGIEVLNPRGRVPASLIIDDSTCLVNLAHFGIPAFAEAFPDRYLQPWRTLPREIPDAFVRTFGEWCHDAGVKGKYSIVPYPACVGWIDREMPGWTRRELDESLELVRTLMTPDWDIHPEMVSHTWVIDTKTGRPYPQRTPDYMENWEWTTDRSVDEIADYLAYALRLIHNVGLPCEGITTPGGFGSGALRQLAQATKESCRAVFRAEIPHYFRHLYTRDERSVSPRVEYVAGLAGEDPQCVVSIIGCTGDWFGGWDGLVIGSPDQCLTADLQGGRLPEVLDRGEPAVLVCHWPGIYCNGGEEGFRIFQEVVRRMHARNDDLLWMKLSEIARYWAAGELTRIEQDAEGTVLRAPYACPAFTLRISGLAGPPSLHRDGTVTPLRAVSRPADLSAGTFLREEKATALCFDLPRGVSRLVG